MITDPNLEEALRRAVDANLRFYCALWQATLDFLKPLDISRRGARWCNSAGAPRPQADPAAAPASAVPPAAPVLLLEAEAGNEVSGVFLVSNRLPRTVSAPVVISPFTDPSGRVVHPPQRVEPELLALDPGAQSLVQIAVTVSDELVAGVDYRAEISVPGLSDSRVPVMLRRRGAAPATPPPRPSARKVRPKKA
jgi:hypothetical protein